jgi:hypothetical protein
MKKNFLGLLFLAILTTQIAGCGSASKKPSAPIKKVAVVSITISAAHLMASIRTESVQKLLATTSDNLVRVTEAKLAGIMKVSKVAGFIDNPGYRNAGVKAVAAKGDLDFMTPKVNGKAMVMFSKEDDDVVDGVLTPEVAKKLCAELKVDGVILIYSEWSGSMGHFVPLMKADTANIVTMWDKRGEQVFNKRVDVGGENTLGAVGAMVVNAGTIKEWSTAYGKSLDEIFQEMKQLSL